MAKKSDLKTDKSKSCTNKVFRKLYCGVILIVICGYFCGVQVERSKREKEEERRRKLEEVSSTPPPPLLRPVSRHENQNLTYYLPYY